METGSYTVKTSAFEGPFGVLLELIEGRKLFINDLSLAEVTDDYLNYIKSLSNTNATQVANFIVVAATLILIKSKSLLPNLDLTSEEESDVKSLEERLKLYNLFIKLSQNVKEKFGDRIIFPAEERPKEVVVFLPDSQITRESMMTFASEALGRMPTKTFLPEVEVRKVISIEEMIEKLASRIESSIQMSFREFSGKPINKEEKFFVIVSFLAMLELVRQGILNAIQENHGEDITIEKQTELK